MKARTLRRWWLPLCAFVILFTIYLTADKSIYPSIQLESKYINQILTHFEKVLLFKEEAQRCVHGHGIQHIQKNISSGHFPIIVPYIEPDILCEDRVIYIPVVVNSAACRERGRHLRATIRQTWGNATNYSGDKKWRVFFTLGICTDEKQNEMNIEEALEKNDIILGNVTDIYKNVVFKTFMGLSWAYSTFSCQYVMKTDDDVYVRIPEVIEWLQKIGSPSPFYGGCIDGGAWVQRHPASPWYITREQFNETWWPPFALGAFKVISSASLPRYFNYTQYRWPFSTDDAYFGVAARDFGIQATNIPGFHVSIKLKSYCELLKINAIGHRLDPKTIVQYYSFYRNSTAKKNCS